MGVCPPRHCFLAYLLNIDVFRMFAEYVVGDVADPQMLNAKVYSINAVGRSELVVIDHSQMSDISSCRVLRHLNQHFTSSLVASIEEVIGAGNHLILLQCVIRNICVPPVIKLKES